MRSFGLDYFNCEPFELNFRLHVLGGFWPLETHVRWIQIVVSVFSFLSFFSLTSMMVIQLTIVYLLLNSPYELAKEFCCISITHTIVIKSLMLLFKIDAVLYLKHKFTDYKNAQTNPAHIAIFEKSNKHILAAIRTLYLMAGSCSVFWVIYPGLDSEGDWKIPFPYRLPIDEWTFPVWVGVYVYQVMSMIGFLINTISVDAMFCGFVCRINAHYDIIMENLKQLAESHEDEEDILEGEYETYVRKIFKENIKLHQELLQDIELFKELYSPLCFIHFMGMVSMTGTAIIDFVKIPKNINYLFHLLQRLLYISVGVWDTFLYCYYASKMQQKSMELSKTFYNIPWYRMKPSIRRDFMFVIFKCQQIPKVKVAHYFYLDLKAFVQVLKISYDVTAILFRVVQD